MVSKYGPVVATFVKSSFKNLVISRRLFKFNFDIDRSGFIRLVTYYECVNVFHFNCIFINYFRSWDYTLIFICLTYVCIMINLLIRYQTHRSIKATSTKSTSRKSIDVTRNRFITRYKHESPLFHLCSAVFAQSPPILRSRVWLTSLNGITI